MKNKYLLIATIAIVMIASTGCSKITISKTPNNNPAPKEIAQPIAQAPAETTPQKQDSPAPVLTTPTPSLVDCKSDINCLTKRATTCSKTKFLFSSSTENKEAPGLITTLSINYEITGSTGAQCNFVQSTGVFKVTATAAGVQNLMAAEGKTKEQVEAEIKEANVVLNEANASGLKNYCQTNDGNNITEHIQKMLSGKSKLSQIDDKITYEGNIFCDQK